MIKGPVAPSVDMPVYDPSNDSTWQAPETLFEGCKFFFPQKMPFRKQRIDTFLRHGGQQAQIEKSEGTIVLWLAGIGKRCHAPGGAINYLFIDRCMNEGRLLNTEDFLINRGNPSRSDSKPGMGPGRTVHGNSGKTRNKFTVEDECLLWDWAHRADEKGVSIKGNNLYEQLFAWNPRHPPQAWRDHYIKKLENMPRPRPRRDDEKLPASPKDWRNYPSATHSANVSRKPATKRAKEARKASEEKPRKKLRLTLNPASRGDGPETLDAIEVDTQDDVGRQARQLIETSGARGDEADAHPNGSASEGERHDPTQEGENETIDQVFYKAEEALLMKEAEAILRLRPETEDSWWKQFAERHPGHTVTDWKCFWHEDLKQRCLKQLSILKQQSHKSPSLQPETPSRLISLPHVGDRRPAPATPLRSTLNQNKTRSPGRKRTDKMSARPESEEFDQEADGDTPSQQLRRESRESRQSRYRTPEAAGPEILETPLQNIRHGRRVKEKEVPESDDEGNGGNVSDDAAGHDEDLHTRAGREISATLSEVESASEMTGKRHYERGDHHEDEGQSEEDAVTYPTLNANHESQSDESDIFGNGPTIYPSDHMHGAQRESQSSISVDEGLNVNQDDSPINLMFDIQDDSDDGSEVFETAREVPSRSQALATQLPSNRDLIDLDLDEEGAEESDSLDMLSSPPEERQNRKPDTTTAGQPQSEGGEDLSLLQNFVDLYLQDTDMETIRMALKAVSMESLDLADTALNYYFDHNRLPAHTRGIWTPDDDALLERGDSESRRKLMRKHGGDGQAIEKRLKFLRDWDAA